MKRYLYIDKEKTKTIWQEVCSMENLIKAHKNAQKGKGWYKEVKIINSNPEPYLKELQERLINKTYKTSEYTTFIKKDGKKERLIYKLPYYPDRICQWAVVQVIEPFIINNFTSDTYSAIPKRGIHQCLQKLNKVLYLYPEETKYCLKLDIKQYYPSINHNILKEKYKRLFKDKDLLWLLDEIINSTKEEKGIPIGNYLSQYSGNFYLSDFDHWIKEKERIKYYYRYMDDIVILGKTKEELQNIRKEIDKYLLKLELSLKENWQIFPTRVRGVDFVGYRSFGKYILLRKDTKRNFKNKMNKIKLKEDNLSYSDICCIESYNGWLKYCDSFRLKSKYIINYKKK